LQINFDTAIKDEVGHNTDRQMQATCIPKQANCYVYDRKAVVRARGGLFRKGEFGEWRTY